MKTNNNQHQIALYVFASVFSLDRTRTKKPLMQSRFTRCSRWLTSLFNVPIKQATARYKKRQSRRRSKWPIFNKVAKCNTAKCRFSNKIAKCNFNSNTAKCSSIPSLPSANTTTRLNLSAWATYTIVRCRLPRKTVLFILLVLPNLDDY